MNDILNEDFRVFCHRKNCFYNDDGQCDWYDNSVPEDVNKSLIFFNVKNLVVWKNLRTFASEIKSITLLTIKKHFDYGSKYFRSIIR